MIATKVRSFAGRWRKIGTVSANAEAKLMFIADVNNGVIANAICTVFLEYFPRVWANVVPFFKIIIWFIKSF